jgi:hypothetical protein
MKQLRRFGRECRYRLEEGRSMLLAVGSTWGGVSRAATAANFRRREPAYRAMDHSVLR